jgi:hypothetical protein
VESYYITLQNLAELEHYENLKEAHLYWTQMHWSSSVNETLPIFKRCANLRRLTLKGIQRCVLSSEELCDFIMGLKHLTFFHIIYRDIRNCDHFKSVVDQVKAFVLPLRPNFEFYISCCFTCESRVPREFFF